MNSHSETLVSLRSSPTWEYSNFRSKQITMNNQTITMNSHSRFCVLLRNRRIFLPCLRRQSPTNVVTQSYKLLPPVVRTKGRGMSPVFGYLFGQENLGNEYRNSPWSTLIYRPTLIYIQILVDGISPIPRP